MKSGKTESGFKFKVDERVFNDWDFVTLADSISHGGATMKEVNAMLIMVLGEDGFDALKEHIRKKHGYVDVEAMKTEFAEITAASKVKN